MIRDPNRAGYKIGELAEYFGVSTDTVRFYEKKEYWNFYEWQKGLDGSISGSVAEDDVTFDAPLCAFVSLRFQFSI